MKEGEKLDHKQINKVDIFWGYTWKNTENVDQKLVKYVPHQKSAKLYLCLCTMHLSVCPSVRVHLTTLGTLVAYGCI